MAICVQGARDDPAGLQRCVGHMTGYQPTSQQLRSLEKALARSLHELLSQRGSPGPPQQIALANLLLGQNTHGPGDPALLASLDSASRAELKKLETPLTAAVRQVFRQFGAEGKSAVDDESVLKELGLALL